MAAMGKGILTAKKTPKAGSFAATAGVSFALSPALVASTANIGFELPMVGLPIMREGFVTDTGFLPPSDSTQATSLTI